MSTVPFDSHGVFIAGLWRPCSSGETLPLFNPSDGTLLAQIARGGRPTSTRPWPRRRPRSTAPGASSARPNAAACCMRMSAVLEQADELARLEALDVGKPLKQGRADALALARYLEFYGGAADKVMGETIPFANGYTAFTLREPHGVTGHIVPWNYPMQIIGRSVGAALAMGNACVLKPAEEACLTALAFARIADAAGLPAGALNVVPGLGEEAGAALSAHAGVRHLSFTGSVSVGALIQAAAARNTVPVTLELGGKSPQIVFADADLDAALPFLVNAGIQNAGQTCSAASRILVERRVFDDVVARMAERYRALRVGPALADLDVGPVISARQRELVEGYLALAREGGLNIVAEATLADGAGRGGYYVRPTLVADVPAAHRLAQEEIFGPVQVVIAFDGEAEALRIANGTAFGLVAGVWTRDGSRALRMARKLRVRPGVRQQLRRRRRHRAALRRRQGQSAMAARRASRRCTASRR